MHYIVKANDGQVYGRSESLEEVTRIKTMCESPDGGSKKATVKSGMKFSIETAEGPYPFRD